VQRPDSAPFFDRDGLFCLQNKRNSPKNPFFGEFLTFGVLRIAVVKKATEFVSIL
jgi:hypothetical protein